MVHPLIGIHAFLGELAIASFVWVFVEVLNPTKERVSRAKIAALLGCIFLIISWISGGYYYVNYYGSNVKPMIKEGPQPWAHSIFMETKEHVFIFLPFLSFLAFSILKKYGNKIIQDSKIKNAVLLLCILIVMLGAIIAGMGYLISTGARAALEATA